MTLFRTAFINKYIKVIKNIIGIHKESLDYTNLIEKSKHMQKESGDC